MKLETVMLALLVVVMASASTVALPARADPVYVDASGNGLIEVGEQVIFIGDVSFTDQDGKTYTFQSWEWDFGDGTAHAYGREVTHAYDGASTYNIRVYEYVSETERFMFSLEIVVVSPAPLLATVDFEPDHLNLKSKGKWVTCYIELPKGYDVADIVVGTVILNGKVYAESRPTKVEDHDHDGIPDLMVKFSRSDVERVLKPGDYVVITIGGALKDGTCFEGSDTIRVKK